MKVPVHPSTTQVRSNRTSRWDDNWRDGIDPYLYTAGRHNRQTHPSRRQILTWNQFHIHVRNDAGENQTHFKPCEIHAQTSSRCSAKRIPPKLMDGCAKPPLWFESGWIGIEVFTPMSKQRTRGHTC